MTLEQLRIFVAVAEREHMTGAARALNITQSAASSAIAALEERHAVKLFHRVGRGITLTETGRAFLSEARGVLGRAAAAQAMLDEMGGLKRGTLRVVASQTIAAYWLPPILAAFRARYPALTVDLAIGNTEQAAARVRDGEADLGIVEGEVNDAALAQWQIGEDRLLLIQATPFDKQTPDATWLKRQRWVLREPGSGTRSTFENHLGEVGVAAASLDVALVLPSNESVRTAVESGAGIAALSSLVVAPSLASQMLHAMPLSDRARPFFGLRHKERYRSKAADALLDLIEERQRKA
ncbi:LysR family transcriptional regulator [Stakelama marina]|uniref:LysR family transcriptional regulator n=1 Tax=Stakelama marina TaxID=2826939 RepID=A0A8T4IE03_9SPHN|nr:LysR family transcriptional regulator [Stakelama marina]MBR0552292.1 LysR family transcriptional regulator [Stakelama marina]